MTIAFNVFYPADWPREISQLASYGEEEIEILVKRFERVLPSECSLVKLLEKIEQSSKQFESIKKRICR